MQTHIIAYIDTRRLQNEFWLIPKRLVTWSIYGPLRRTSRKDIKQDIRKNILPVKIVKICDLWKVLKNIAFYQTMKTF